VKHASCPNDRAVVVNGQYRKGCAKCIHTKQNSGVYAAKYKRDRIREDHRQDIVQRYNGDQLNPEWFKMYPDKAREEFGQATVERVLRG
jgi:hypothetical protein